MCIFGNIITRIISVAALILAVIAIIFSCIGSKVPPLEGIQTELDGAGGETILNGENVIFDKILNDQSDSISYNLTTGEFTVTKPGTYNVAWWTAPDGAGPAINVSFAVAVNGVPYSTASSPIVSVQMAASALVTINTVPATISLVNVTGDDVFIPSTPVQAGMVITE